MSYVYLILVFLSAIVLFSGCSCSTGVKSECSGFKGDGSISYIAKPGFFASEGVCVRFDTFEMSSGFERKLSFESLPLLKDNDYLLYFNPDFDIGESLSSNIVIKTTLKDSGSNVVWDVENSTLNNWVRTESRGKSVYYHINNNYYVTNSIHDCRFRSKKDEEYILSISCKVKNEDDQKVSGRAYFSLKGGGYK